MTINAGYKAYLVRVWPGTDGGSWRVVAEDAQSGDRIQFTSLNGLVNFLAGRRKAEALLPPMIVEEASTVTGKHRITK